MKIYFQYRMGNLYQCRCDKFISNRTTKYYTWEWEREREWKRDNGNKYHLFKRIILNECECIDWCKGRMKQNTNKDNFTVKLFGVSMQDCFVKSVTAWTNWVIERVHIHQWANLTNWFCLQGWISYKNRLCLNFEWYTRYLAFLRFRFDFVTTSPVWPTNDGNSDHIRTNFNDEKADGHEFCVPPLYAVSIYINNIYWNLSAICRDTQRTKEHYFRCTTRIRNRCPSERSQAIQKSIA